MINWFNIPDEGLSNGGLFEVKELEVTENGTYETKGEMYNKVTVNVEGGGGESDFSTAKMTVINNKGWIIKVNDCPVESVDDDEMLFGGFSVNGNNQLVFDVIIYKGYAHILEMVTGVSLDTPVDLETEVSLSGNAEYDAEEEFIAITGDCTITIS